MGAFSTDAKHGFKRAAQNSCNNDANDNINDGN